MTLYSSSEYRTRRRELSPKVQQVREEYAVLAQQAVFRAYPSMPNLGVEICILDAGDMLELFWRILDIGGEAPGGWHQVHDLTLQFERGSDSKKISVGLAGHVAGFYAWYRMRGGMVSILPNSHYFNLESGEWSIFLEGKLQDAKALCLFADAFGDLFHYSHILRHHSKVRSALMEEHLAAMEDPAPLQPFRLFAGTLKLQGDRTTPIRDRQANRLHQVSVHFSDVKNVPVPRVTPPAATPLDPVHFFRDRMYYLHHQSRDYQFCPYGTVNHWNHEPSFDQGHYYVNERTAYFHIEALTPLYRCTGDADVYRSARKWYEWIVRNIWPAPGGGVALACGDRTVYGSSLHNGGLSDAVCTFAEIDGEARWVEPLRQGLLQWPMHPVIPRPLMDQDAWGNEEMNTTGTYNMCTHFAVACWRAGEWLHDDALKAKAEKILFGYTFPGENNGVWPYRPGNYPAPHYDMYLKWQLARLLASRSPRWREDPSFVSLMKKAMDATLREYARERDGALFFLDWTHDKNVTHPGNSARQAAAQLEALACLTAYVDPGYCEPLEKTLRGLYGQLALPEVDRCWHGCWFHVHGNLLSLALHGLHVEGNSPSEMRIVRPGRIS
ncbi:MAG: hypothetical protein HYU36_24530 [Planctomycetes bacterium]|nr:hypothetical protein [Planctomycetota bacterium]